MNVLNTFGLAGCVTICFDFYTPIEIYFGEERLQQKYRRVVTEDSLLEIGIDDKEGCATAIKVVQVGRFSEHDSLRDKVIVDTGSTDGVPVFDLAEWSSTKYFDSDEGFEMLIGKNEVALILSPSKATQVLKNDNVRFGIVDSKLAWILIGEVTNEQRNILVESVTNQQDHGFL